MVQPAHPTNASKTQDDDSTVKELQQAKVDALNARTSESMAQRKLADAEAALQRAKEEAGRATAEAERAKADAKVARESEVVAKGKLADAEAARVAAEQSCHSGTKPRPVLGRFRGWLRRPGAKNP